MSVMWAITSYYNPVRYERRLSNYKIFRANLRIPIVAVELSFDGRFELTEKDADILIQISGGAILWQKERLLNVALKAVPPDVKKVAWVDCDVILKRPDWADEAKRLLDEFSVIQLFSDGIHLKAEDLQAHLNSTNGYRIVPGLARLPDAREHLQVGSNLNKKTVLYHSGYAWAANRNILDDHGFYDAAIVGGADSLMAAAMYNRVDSLTKRYHMDGVRKDHYQRWAIPFRESVAERVGYIDGTIYHLWHGEIENRGYIDRHKQLADLRFEPNSDLRIGANGAWQWARPRPELEEFLRNYFLNRAEDG